MVFISPQSRGVTLLSTSEARAQGWWLLSGRQKNLSGLTAHPAAQSQGFSRHITTKGWLICSSSF